MRRICTFILASAVFGICLFLPIHGAQALELVGGSKPLPTAADHRQGSEGARIILITYSDFQCPFCSRHHENIANLLREYPQDIQWVFRHFPLSFHPSAMDAAIASECAASAGDETAFWEYAALLFGKQGEEWNQDAFKSYASSVGVKSAEFDRCFADRATAEKVTSDMDSGSSAGVNGTPATFLIDEAKGPTYIISGAQPYETLKEAIDKILSGSMDFDTAVARSRSARAEQRALLRHGRTALRENAKEKVKSRSVSITAKDHLLGEADAPVTAIVYSDFECPFCAQHHLTMEELMTERPSDVNYVIRHFPLSFHQNALKAAVASECVVQLAGESSFFPFAHDIFQNGVEPKGIVSMAKSLGIDMQKFSRCQKGRRAASVVRGHMRSGTALGINGTPMTIFLNNRTKQTIMSAGAVPIDVLEQDLDQVLGK